MAQSYVDVTSTGTTATLIASKTFPIGVQLTQFADKGELFKFGDSEMAKFVQSPNGAMIYYDVASTAKTIDIALIPTSDEDVALFTLAQANQSGVGKRASGDIITLVIDYPKFKVVYSNGKLLKSPQGYTAGSDGQITANTYSFVFEKGEMIPL